MNLYERFWQTIDEYRQARFDRNRSQSENYFDLNMTPVHPPEGVRSEAGLDLSAIVRRAPRRFPPYVISQHIYTPKPFCLIYTVGDIEMPQFHDLFEQYVDKNAFIAEMFLRLRPHSDIPYVMFLGPKSYFLYDANEEELIRWGTDFGGLDELLIQPVKDNENVLENWNNIPRKTNAQRGDEFGRWLDLWKVGIGARTSATPSFMQVLMQKVLLLFMYDQVFGLTDIELRLRTNFLDQRSVLRFVNRSHPPNPFDGVAWLHQAASEVLSRYKIEFLEWTNAESNFFAVMSAETRHQFGHFILELFLQSQAKFTSTVQMEVFSDANARLKLWKFSVMEPRNIKRKLHVDDINVYEPVHIDLTESGLGWSFYIVDQILDFWQERCIYFETQLSEHRQLKLQFDMFQQPDLDKIKIPTVKDLFDQAFSTSIKIYYDLPIERAALEYLIIIKVFEVCQNISSPLRSLHHLNDIFIEKERVPLN